MPSAPLKQASQAKQLHSVHHLKKANTAEIKASSTVCYCLPSGALPAARPRPPRSRPADTRACKRPPCCSHHAPAQVAKPMPGLRQNCMGGKKQACVRECLGVGWVGGWWSASQWQHPALKLSTQHTPDEVLLLPKGSPSPLPPHISTEDNLGAPLYDLRLFLTNLHIRKHRNHKQQ